MRTGERLGQQSSTHFSPAGERGEDFEPESGGTLRMWEGKGGEKQPSQAFSLSRLVVGGLGGVRASLWELHRLGASKPDAGYSFLTPAHKGGGELGFDKIGFERNW